MGSRRLTGVTMAGRFDVLDHLGGGGMGEVYRARDRELDEIVALKVIRDDLAALGEVVDRFRQEVKLARRVTHKNVARIFELGFHEQLAFCTMELIEGEPLSEQISGGRRLSAPDAVAICVALCDALEAAHAAGVIHRDLKPGNILITPNGRVVLADFGLAAVRHAAGDLSGTPQYVAPEQARGEPPTPAADIYALGVLLCELLTGHPAFRGSVRDVLAAKQSAEQISPAPGDDVDLELADLIAHATARSPADRLPSARGFRRGLLSWLDGPVEVTMPIAPAPSPEPTTVKVHPPRVAGDGAPHLAAAFHTELVHALAAQPGLRVITRPAGCDDPATCVVDVLVDGNQVDVSASTAGHEQAVSIRTAISVSTLGSHAAAATRAITTLALPVDRGPATSETRDGALDLILRARHLTKSDRLALEEALSLYEAALATAPGDARALAGLAMCKVRLAFFTAASHPEYLAEAEVAAFDALAAAPERPETQLAAGHLELHRGDAVRGAFHFRTAIARAPHLPEAHAWLGSLLLEAGYVVDGSARARDALAMAPDYEVPRWDLARAYALEGHWDRSDRMLDELKALLKTPRRWTVRARMAAWRGDFDGVRSIAEEISSDVPERLGFEHSLALNLCTVLHTSSWSGLRDKILARANDSTLVGSRRRTYVAQLVAEAAGVTGDVDTGLSMLTLANDNGLIDLLWLRACPLLAPLRADPRFGAIEGPVAERADAVHDALFGEAPPGPANESTRGSAAIAHTLKDSAR